MLSELLDKLAGGKAKEVLQKDRTIEDAIKKADANPQDLEAQWEACHLLIDAHNPRWKEYSIRANKILKFRNAKTGDISAVQSE